jgi:hypothetical protein
VDTCDSDCPAEVCTLLRLLAGVDRQLTPAHIARRFADLVAGEGYPDGSGMASQSS